VDQAFCLNVPLYGDPPCPCPLEVPPGAIIEDEPCGEAMNDGCNQSPPVFAPAACGDVIFGSAWAEGGSRDTDWYLVNHPGGALQATLTSQFPGVCFIVDGIDTCDPIVVGQIGCSDGCENIAVAGANLPAGEYVVFVATGECSGGEIFDGHPCGTRNDYVLEIACVPVGRCCLGVGECELLTQAQCVSQGGTYGGDGSSCNGTGACCLLDGTCVVTTIGTCIFSGGDFQGECTTCTDTICCGQQVGACCLLDGTCIETNPGVCAISSGVYQGDCTTCAGAPCGP
jgi:hypothetical protein